MPVKNMINDYFIFAVNLMAYTYEYPRPALTVDSMIFSTHGKNIEIILIQRDKPPFEGRWALPGGFVDMGETLEEAAERELQEETCITNVDLFQFHAFSKLGRDPRGRTISIIFYGYADKETLKVKAADDARDVKWFKMSNLPELGFDHNEIIQLALKKIFYQ